MSLYLKKYKCPCGNTKSNITKTANQFSGNTNTPNHLNTDPYLYSNMVNYSTALRNGKTVIINVKNINGFGRWEGVSYGYGKRPTNTF